MENNSKVYSKITSIIKESNYYKILSDKTEFYNSNKKRVITTHSLANIAVRFAKIFAFDVELIEVIIYARDLGYPPYGQLGQAIIKEKYKDFSIPECSIQILKNIIQEYKELTNNDINIPPEIIDGILGSFNIKESKPGLLVAMIETIYEAGRISTNQNIHINEDEKQDYIINIDYLWNKYMLGNEVTNKAISENILNFSEAQINELGD